MHSFYLGRSLWLLIALCTRKTSPRHYLEVPRIWVRIWPSGYGCSISNICALTRLYFPVSRHIVSIASSSNNLTWLQRQQQKLRERKEVQMRTERCPQESRLITELRNIQQHSYSRVLRPSASHRADGYTSDTTHFADDDDDQEDFTIPLHINTTTSPTHKLNSVGSAPASPLLPNRTSSRRYYGTAATLNHQSSSQSYPSGIVGLHGRQKSDSAFDKERPFVAVKRAHEQTRKFKEIQVSALCFLVMQGMWVFHVIAP